MGYLCMFFFINIILPICTEKSSYLYCDYKLSHHSIEFLLENNANTDQKHNDKGILLHAGSDDEDGSRPMK